LERFGDGGGDAPRSFIESELALVQQRRERHETDEAGREERQTPPDPFQ
jgi:hypothetical protein